MRIKRGFVCVLYLQKHSWRERRQPEVPCDEFDTSIFKTSGINYIVKWKQHDLSAVNLLLAAC